MKGNKEAACLRGSTWLQGRGKGTLRQACLAGVALVLALALGLLGGVLGPPQQVHAATTSWGCEHNAVVMNGQTVYACTTLAQPCLNTHNVQTFAVDQCLPYGSLIYVYGQFAFARHDVLGSDIWDGIWTGGIYGREMVSDFYVNTGNYAAFSPPMPSCGLVGGWGGTGIIC